MELNRALLEEHSSFVHPGLRIRERFVTFSTGEGSTVGVLSSPVGAAAPVAWVICHSFGLKQVNLNMLEVGMARMLASEGFSDLRFQCQGYGDSECLDGRPGVSTHIRDTKSAVAFMEAFGARSIGVGGTRFGGAVAVAAAARLGLELLVTIAPTVDLRKYVKDLMRAHSFSTLTDKRGDDGVSVTDMKRQLADSGAVNLKGLVLDRETFGEMCSFDVEAKAFNGRALVLQVSRSPARQPGLQRLADALAVSGAEIDFEVVVDSTASHLGQSPVRHLSSDTLGASYGELERYWLRGASLDRGTGEMTRIVLRGSIGEYPVFVPSDGEFIGATLTLRVDGAQGLVLMMTGGGKVPRSHRFSLWTKAAQSMAARGIASIRMEWPGTGDSTGDNFFMFDALPWRHALRVAEFGVAATGIERVGVLGNCGGARAALKVAQEMPACQSVVAVLLQPLGGAGVPGLKAEQVQRLSPAFRKLPGWIRRLVTRGYFAARHLYLKAVVARRPGQSFMADLRRLHPSADILLMESDSELAGSLPGLVRNLGSSGGEYDIQLVRLPSTTMQQFKTPEEQSLVIDRAVQWFVHSFAASSNETAA